MSATAGWHGTLQESGTAVPVTGEACSFVSGSDPNKVYQVGNGARRVWDPLVAVIIKDGGSTVSAANYSFDYLSGTITFAGHSVTGAITVDGSYLPLVTIAQVRKSSLKLSRNQLDCSNFDDATGWHAYTQGIAGGTCDAELLSMLNASQDSEAGGQFTYFTSDRPKVLILADTQNNSRWRLWVRTTDLQQDIDVNGLVVCHVSWKQSNWQGKTISYAA